MFFNVACIIFRLNSSPELSEECHVEELGASESLLNADRFRYSKFTNLSRKQIMF
jgi:hypothetical protein